MAKTRKKGVAMDYNSLIEGVSSQNLSFLMPLKGSQGSAGVKTALGVSLLMMNMGTIEKRDAQGTLLGQASVKGVSYGLGYGVTSGPWGLGLTAKSLQEDLVTEKGKAIAFDLGGLWEAGDFALGVSARNLGTRYKVGSVEKDLSSVFRLGVAWHPQESSVAHLDRFTIALDGEKSNDQDPKVMGGVECLLTTFLTLRAGYEHTADGAVGQGMTFGLGMWTDFTKISRSFEYVEESKVLDYKRSTDSPYGLELDYAYLMRDVFDDLHRLTLSFQF
jgi:hypothetical protein